MLIRSISTSLQLCSTLTLLLERKVRDTAPRFGVEVRQLCYNRDFRYFVLQL